MSPSEFPAGTLAGARNAFLRIMLVLLAVSGSSMSSRDLFCSNLL